MPEQSVIVWDLETVPDLPAAARMLSMEGAPDEELRAGLGPGFPKHPLHKIACIGALVAERQPEGWQVQALGAPHIGQRTEADLIRSFIDRIGELRPQLITFNGHSFDLPVLRYRAMVNRVSAVGLQVRPMVQAGRIAEVAQYCESDVLNIYRLWLIYELFRGAITAEQLAFSEARAADFILWRRKGSRFIPARPGGEVHERIE
jgi:3'-5' exonuclease